MSNVVKTNFYIMIRKLVRYKSGELNNNYVIIYYANASLKFI